MLLEDQITQLLITLGVVIIALAIAGTACLLLGGKAVRVRISAWALMMLLIFPLYLLRTPMAVNYYGLLFTDALFDLAFLEWGLIGACSIWLEWLSPPPQWKSRDYREKSIFEGILVTVACIGLAAMFLPRMTANLLDMATGPSFEAGVVEQLTLRQTRGLVSGGDFVVRGISYFTADLPWYKTLTVGQSVRFPYSPNSHYGFPPGQMILTPLGLAFPVLVVGCVLLVFSAGYFYLRPSNKSANQSRSEDNTPFGPFISSVADYHQTKGAGPVIVLMILPLLVIGLIALFLTAPFR
jgi:hypothetical protein